MMKYRTIYNIRRTKSRNLNVSHWGHWWRPLQPTSSIITDAKSVDSNLVHFDRKTCLDQPGILHNNSSWHSFSSTERVSANVLLNTRYNRLKIGMDDVGVDGADVITVLEPTSSVPIFKPLYLVIYTTLTLAFSVLLTECLELLLCKIPGWSMHVFISKSTRFESTDFASVMIDDVGCSRRHQCPQCDVSRLGLKLSLRNILKPSVKWRRKM